MKFFYFDENDTFESNKKIWKELCSQYHPDRPGGDAVIMKQINSEWAELKRYYESNAINEESDDLVDLFAKSHEEWFSRFPKHDNQKEPLITFKGRRYKVSDKILEEVARDHGGLGLMEFMQTKEWKSISKEKNNE